MKLPKPWPEDPPPGPFRRSFWSSPLRGPWLTGVIGLILLGGVTIVALTGFLSHAAYNPSLGRNQLQPSALPFTTFDWPTHPAWLYVLTQGAHVNVGLAVIPILLAKLWSVIPKLFAWPPVGEPAEMVERLAIALLVSSSVFLFATGVANAQYWYPFGFNFVYAHYYAAVIFVAALIAHVVVKMPIALRAIRARGGLAPLGDNLLHTLPEPDDGDPLIASVPRAATISRRGLLGLVGGASTLLFLGNVGQSIGGPVRKLSLFAPRRPGGFPINKTAQSAGVGPAMVGEDYALVLAGGDAEVRLTRTQLLAMEQRMESLPIGCVEGWSTTQDWEGVRISDLARLAGVPDAEQVRVESLQPRGVLREATLSRDQLHDDRALLALRVAGEDLTLDHGFPARVIVPALPGVHNTKWVGKMTFA